MTGNVEDIETALTILKQAMEVELEGHRFYTGEALTTRDQTGGEMFATLASEEEKHYDLIKKEFDALTRNEKWVSFPEIKPVKIDTHKPLFPQGREALERAINSKSTDWDALLFGFDIEIKSYDLYRKAASEVSAPLGRQMFEFLAAQERGHFDTLMMRYDALFGPVAWRY